MNADRPSRRGLVSTIATSTTHLRATQLASTPLVAVIPSELQRIPQLVAYVGAQRRLNPEKLLVTARREKGIGPA